ncbi:MAG: hypothetical protein RIC95_01940 [Vicingaceae bacterium]
MRQFVFIIGAFLLLPFLANGQDFQWQKREFIFEAAAGMNYTRFDLAEEEMRPLARPFTGFGITYALNPQWGIKGNGLFAQRASKIKSGTNYQSLGFDFQIMPQFKWDDLYFNAGISHHLPINQGLQYKGSASSERTRVEPDEISVVNPQISALLGFEMKLMPNWKIYTNFSIPLKAQQHNNVQVGLTYRLSRRAPSKESARKIRRRTTAKQIKELRNGALLVRLRTSKPVIEALKRKGFPQKAKEVARKQRLENINLIKAFHQYYNFSEVRFFMSDYSSKVRKGKTQHYFVNDSLVVDSSLVLRNTKHLYTAEFGQIEEDTATFFSHYDLVQTGNFAFVQVPRFYGGGGNTFTALVIKDQQFEQLHRPFPYYSRALFKAMEDHPGHRFFYFPVMLFSPMTYGECVENLNQKLHRFYRKVERRERR